MAKIPSPAEIQYLEQHLQDDRRRDIIAANIACGAIAYFAIALRLVSRRLKQLPLGLDDWTIIAGLVSSIDSRSENFFPVTFLLSLYLPSSS